jgi:hypothetical protein
MIPFSELPRQSPGVAMRHVKGRTVLQNAGGEELCELNATARALWELCDGETSPEEMVEAICAIHDAPRETIEDDVRRTLGAFTDAGALESPEPGRASSDEGVDS